MCSTSSVMHPAARAGSRTPRRRSRRRPGRRCASRRAARRRARSARRSRRAAGRGCPDGVSTASKAMDPTTVSVMAAREASECLAAAMRAIRITEWGGPEVLELVEDAPVPEPGDQRGARPRHARRHQLRRHPRARELLPRALRAAARARARRSRAWSSATAHGFEAGQRVVALVGTGGYAEYVAAPAATTFADPRRRRRRDRARAAAAGPDRVAPVPHVARRLAPGESVVVHAARRRRRLARRPARQARSAPAA